MILRPFLRRTRLPARGQALVEFALILPILVLLLVMAIDLGRVFFGWVALQNAARIGADHAARFPQAWPPPGDNSLEDQALILYVDLIKNDLQALNCDPDQDGDGDVDLDDLPVTFADVDGNGAPKDEGDHAIVRLTCAFDLLTPLASLVMGGPVHMSAEALFAINKSATLALPTPLPTPTPTPTPAGATPTPTPTPAPCAAPVAQFVGTPPLTGSGQLTVSFTDQSTSGVSCPITSWAWNFGAGDSWNAQSPPAQTYNYVGPGARDRFTVTLTVTSSSGSDVETKVNYITVNRP
ncbi:MAG TPA: TadE/TadG family type IV pilus assembly protein [Candidatus Binatia bacterium]|nr:TadE/TadG family type IV pilus assembly protein [Candidatus Binatia bacterium]